MCRQFNGLNHPQPRLHLQCVLLCHVCTLVRSLRVCGSLDVLSRVAPGVDRSVGSSPRRPDAHPEKSANPLLCAADANMFPVESVPLQPSPGSAPFENGESQFCESAPPLHGSSGAAPV